MTVFQHSIGTFVRDALLEVYATVPDQNRMFGIKEQVDSSLPAVPGWSYMVRFCRPRKEILGGSWNFPAAHRDELTPLARSRGMLLNASELALSVTLVFTRAKWWHALVLVGLWIFTVYYFGPIPLN